MGRSGKAGSYSEINQSFLNIGSSFAKVKTVSPARITPGSGYGEKSNPPLLQRRISN